MKNYTPLILSCLLAGCLVTAALAGDKPACPASTCCAGKTATDLPSLAKIPFATALEAAIAAVPGSVIKAELEAEDDGVTYSFEIVGADKAITEVEIDAVTGKVLETEKKDGEAGRKHGSDEDEDDDHRKDD